MPYFIISSGLCFNSSCLGSCKTCVIYYPKLLPPGATICAHCMEDQVGMVSVKNNFVMCGVYEPW
jgi:hypothetical protein